MSVSFLPERRKNRNGNKKISNPISVTASPSSIEINLMVVPFYRDINDSKYQYIHPPTSRLFPRVMPRLAWDYGGQHVEIGELSSMWASSAGIRANAYINPLSIPASSCSNVAAFNAAQHLFCERPVWVSPDVPTGDGAVYRTKGYKITDYEIARVVMAPSNKMATWKEWEATPVTVMKFPHGKNLIWASGSIEAA